MSSLLLEGELHEQIYDNENRGGVREGVLHEKIRDETSFVELDSLLFEGELHEEICDQTSFLPDCFMHRSYTSVS